MTPITDREIGSIEQKVATLEHNRRNERMIVDGLVEDLDSLRLEFSQFKYKTYGVISAAGVFIGFLSR